MDRTEREAKMKACRKFMQKVADECGKDGAWKLVGSCNHDASVYLVPAGTEDQISYYGKPADSLRFSDHWNWYSNLKKCKIEGMVQCRSVDMPRTAHRTEPGKPSRPKFGIQVAYFDEQDGAYHHVFGEKFDRRTRSWTWVETDPKDTVYLLMRGNPG